MRATAHARLRAAALSIVTAAALAPAVGAAPVQAASTGAVTASAPATPTFWSARSRPSSSVVTLLTGDRVMVQRDGQGHTSASVLPGSPHYRRPVKVVSSGDHTWVIPKLPAAVMTHLDVSLFDVAALARADGPVPLHIEFAAGAAPRRLPGLQVRTPSAARTASGRAVSASYDPRQPLPRSLTRSLADVSTITVPGASSTTVAPLPAYELHTLTVDVTDVDGGAPAVVAVFVFNVDDGGLMSTLAMAVDGQLKLSVPDGHYLVTADTFSRTVVQQVTVEGADLDTHIAMADATVTPSMTVPGKLHMLTPAFDILERDATGRSSLDWGSFGFSKVAPLTAVIAGRVDTQVSGLWSTKGYHPFTFQDGHEVPHPVEAVTAATQVVNGIPADLAFHYRASDFASVAMRYYATGPAQLGLSAWAGVDPDLDVSTFDLFPTSRPGVVHARLLGNRHLIWRSLAMPSASFKNDASLTESSRFHRGQQATVSFFRGPVAPVADRGGESGDVGNTCELCVVDGQLGGVLSMAATAGTDQFGITSTGRFAMYRGRTRVAHGSAALIPYVRHVEPGQHLRLIAATSAANPRSVLSSHVNDTFRFAVPDGDRVVVPLLRAAYVPPTDLRSVGPAGRVSYPVTFDNVGPVDARIARASVRWSVDGRRWHAASLTRRDDNTFQVSYVNPVATSAHRYLSLHVSATDVAGRSVSESVEHAYVLPHATAGTSQPAPARHRNVFRPSKLCRTSSESRYSCFVKLSRATLAAGKASPDQAGWGAPALRSAYGLGADSGSPGTVAVVVAYDYPHAEADMNRYRAQYGLPACGSASGCFRKVNQSGQVAPLPDKDADWGVEAALDLQMVSAACPTCHIVLVEADEASDDALFAAEQAAVDAGATVINHSFGRYEVTGTDTDAQHFVHPGVTDVAATGDNGYEPPSFPASSPDVIAVGGTELSRSLTNARGWSERVWGFGGSGCSAYFPKPVGQDDTACHHRTTADIAALASGLAVFDTSLPRRYRGWLMVGGTSASSPLVSGMVGSAGALGVRPADLYAAHAAAPTLFNDIVRGTNGYCRASYICTAGPGYDGPTGLGSPAGTTLFTP